MFPLIRLTSIQEHFLYVMDSEIMVTLHDHEHDGSAHVS